jgi:hypothetical protein
MTRACARPFPQKDIRHRSGKTSYQALFEALNVVCGEHEKRSFLNLNALTLAFPLGALLFMVFALASISRVGTPIANHITEDHRFRDHVSFVPSEHRMAGDRARRCLQPLARPRRAFGIRRSLSGLW